MRFPKTITLLTAFVLLLFAGALVAALTRPVVVEARAAEGPQATADRAATGNYADDGGRHATSRLCRLGDLRGLPLGLRPHRGYNQTRIQGQPDDAGREAGLRIVPRAGRGPRQRSR